MEEEIEKKDIIEDDYLDEFLEEGKITEAEKQETLRVRKIFDQFLEKTKQEVSDKMSMISIHAMETVSSEITQWLNKNIDSFFKIEEVSRKLASFEKNIDIQREVKDHHEIHVQEMRVLKEQVSVMIEQGKHLQSTAKEVEEAWLYRHKEFVEQYDIKIDDLKTTFESMKIDIESLSKSRDWYDREFAPDIYSTLQYQNDRMNYLEYDLRRKSKLIEQLTVTQVFLLLPMALNVGYGIYEFFKKGKKDEGNQPS